MNSRFDRYRVPSSYDLGTYGSYDASPLISWLQVVSLFLVLMLCGVSWASTGQVARQARHPLEARNLSFTHLTLEHGLSQAGINAIVQDHQGYIWFGTQEGLNRYDGQNVQVFEHDRKNPKSLANDWIWSLLVDRDGVLWVGTDAGGLNRFDPARKMFSHFQHKPGDVDSLSHDRVRVIYQDREGAYWIGTDGGGLNRFDAKTGKFVRYQHDPNDSKSLPNDSVLTLLEDRSGNFWVGTNGGGLAKMDRRTGQFDSYRYDSKVMTSLSDDHVRALYEDRDGDLWIGTYEAGLNRLHPGSTEFQRYQYQEGRAHSLSSNRIRSIFQDREGTLWIATDNGLNQWLPATEDFTRYLHDPSDPSTLSDNRLTTLFQDRGGVLWIGSYNGVNKWNYVSDAFTYYQKYGSELTLSSDIVTTVLESDSEELWVGTYGGGLDRLHRKTGEVKHYQNDPRNDNSLSDNRVMSVVTGPDQGIWVGTRNGGLNRLDPKTEQFTHFRHDPNKPDSLSANGVTSILAEANGVIWVGTYGGGLNLGTLNSSDADSSKMPKDAIGGGLNRGDLKTGQFKVFRHDPKDPKSISSDRVLAIYRDRSGALWIGTEDGGLNRFDEATQTFIRYQHDDHDPISLGSNSAWDILETRDGSLWVATGGGGLNYWPAKYRKEGRPAFKAYRKSDGLLSDTVQGLIEDEGGYLWLSSNRGLQRFDPATGEVRQYDRTTGLKGNEFNTSARYKNRSGRLYFGGTTGLVAFHPNRIRTNQHKPDIVVNANTRLGPLDLMQSGLPQGVSEAGNSAGAKGGIELNYRDDLITFEFTGLDFTSPEKNQYRYKLEGFDQDWTGPVSFKRTTYTNLPDGDYTFRIMASNNDGVWNEQGRAITVTVIPPPWKTGWAFSLYGLIAASALLAFIRAQRLKLRKEVEQRLYLEKLVQLRTQEIAERNDQLHALNVQLKSASFTDALTGLHNRRYMEEFIEAEVAQATRRAQDANAAKQPAGDYSLSFMMVDLDGFKAINDTYGHHAGDMALMQVKDILQSCCRKSDTIIRWGGDEFLIVSRNTSPTAVETLAERIRVRLADHLYQVGHGNIGRLSGSIGFALHPFTTQKPEEVNWQQVAAMADSAAYLAKENGRNAWVGFYGTVKTQAEELSKIKDNLAELLALNILDIRTSIKGKIILGEQKAVSRARA